ncbi:MAG: helical backbone metal receptor [Oligoflexia bacterium]|nr:helical backbone metal receptor [Oligoflexia bacterium]
MSRSLAFALAFFFALNARAREIVDTTGVKTTLPDAPARIVTLAPSLGELAAEFAGERLERIVGVTEYTDYPPALKRVRSVGPYHRFSIEAVAALRPDLVLATRDGNLKDQIDHLRELKLPVVVVSTENFEQVESSIRLVGEAMGVPEEGARMASRFRSGLERFRERARGRQPRRVLLQVSDKPVVVAGGKSFLQDALRTIGARNVYGDLDATYPRPAIEDLLARDPEVIIVIALGTDLAPFRAMARDWIAFPRLAAVKKKRIFVLQGDEVTRPSLRLLEGLSRLEKAIFGGVDGKS